jgi:hypothetical protein
MLATCRMTRPHFSQNGMSGWTKYANSYRVGAPRLSGAHHHVNPVTTVGFRLAPHRRKPWPAMVCPEPRFAVRPRPATAPNRMIA